MQGPFLREYGGTATVNFTLYKTDASEFKVDAVAATGDSIVMKDEGAEANSTNLFVDEGNGYSLTLTPTEMQAARVVIYLIDSVPKVWLDESVVIETYGSSAAMHAFPFGTATVTVGVNNDKTAYSISGTKTTLDALTDGSGVTVTTNNDKTGYTVSTVSDKTGYSISGTKTTLDALTDGSGVTVITNSDKAGYSISGTKTTLDALTDGSGGVTIATGAITSAVFAANAITASAVAAGAIDLIWDEVVDGTTTGRQSFVISNTLLAGKVSGGSSTTAVFRDLADTKNRITIIFTTDGDKTTVTMNSLT